LSQYRTVTLSLVAGTYTISLQYIQNSNLAISGTGTKAIVSVANIT